MRGTNLDARQQFCLTKRLTQFSYFRYEISFRDGSRIVPFIAYLGRLRESAITQRGVYCGRPRWLRVPPSVPLSLPLTNDLLLRLPFFSSRSSSSSSSFSASRLGPPAFLFHLSPSHSSPACLTTAADADVNSLRGTGYTLIRYSRFFLIPRRHHAYS